MKRKITITLTEAQYRALGGAVATAESTYWEMADDDPADGGGYFGREARVLARAWSKINGTWHERGRS